MVELILRLSLIGGAAYAAQKTGMSTVVPILGGLGGFSILTAILSRWAKSFAPSLQAVADSAVIAYVAGQAHSLNTFGFLVAIPPVYAIARRGASPLIASLCAITLYGAFAMFAKGAPAPDFHAKVFAVVLLATFAQRATLRSTIISTEEIAGPAEVEIQSQPAPAVEPAALPLPAAEPEADYAQAHIARLERQILLERGIAELMAIRPNGNALPQIAATLNEVLEAEAVAIYVRAESEDDLIVQAHAGSWPAMLLDSAIPLIPGESADGMRWAIQAQIAGLTDEGEHISTPLIRNDRLVGFALVRTSRDNASIELEELASCLSTLVVEDAEARRSSRRAEEAELLYAIAGIAQGSLTPQSLANRIVRELSSLVRADGLSIVWTSGIEGEPATHGEPFDINPLLTFSQGLGIDGWVRAGTPEIAAFRTLGDRRCDAGEALRSRVGSFILIPLQSGDLPFGYIVAATHRAGGLDTSDLLTMRLIGIELSRTIARLLQPAGSDEGIVTPVEFHEMTRVGGAIVYIEASNRERLARTHGDRHVDRAIRQFTNLVRGKLPAAGIVCRRDQDDLLAFLSGWGHEDAARWANEIQALASMIAVEGEPLAVRTKVANLPNRVISAA